MPRYPKFAAQPVGFCMYNANWANACVFFVVYSVFPGWKMSRALSSLSEKHTSFLQGACCESSLAASGWLCLSSSFSQIELRENLFFLFQQETDFQSTDWLTLLPITWPHNLIAGQDWLPLASGMESLHHPHCRAMCSTEWLTLMSVTKSALPLLKAL